MSRAGGNAAATGTGAIGTGATGYDAATGGTR